MNRNQKTLLIVIFLIPSLFVSSYSFGSGIIDDASLFVLDALKVSPDVQENNLMIQQLNLVTRSARVNTTGYYEHYRKFKPLQVSIKQAKDDILKLGVSFKDLALLADIKLLSKNNENRPVYIQFFASIDSTQLSSGHLNKVEFLVRVPMRLDMVTPLDPEMLKSIHAVSWAWIDDIKFNAQLLNPQNDFSYKVATPQLEYTTWKRLTIDSPYSSTYKIQMLLGKAAKNLQLFFDPN